MIDIFKNNDLFLKWENDIVGEISSDQSVSLRNTGLNPVVSAYFEGKKALNASEFKAFLSDRVISKDRKDIHSILARLGMKEYDVFRIARNTRAFNLSDKFWISYSAAEEYETTFIAIFRDLYNHSVNTEGDSIASPSGGNIKQYVFYEKDFGIAKHRMHPYSTDAINEVIAYRLSRLFNMHCCYAEMISDGVVFSKYEYDFNREFMVHARTIATGEVLSLDNYEYLIDAYFKESEYEILKMIVFDFLLNQDDRHMSNWGVLMDLEGSKRMYSLYDNGRCLFYEADEDMVMTALKSPALYSNSFGLVGTYYDAVKDIAQKHDISRLINTNVTASEIEGCFSGFNKYPEWKIEACVSWITWALEAIRGINSATGTVVSTNYTHMH